MRKKIIHSLVFIGVTFILSQCSITQPVKLEDRQRYELNATVNKTYTQAPQAGVMLVTTATSNPTYQTTQMLYMVEPYELRTFALNQWVASPAKMLLPLLVESLSNSGHYQAVVGPPYVGDTDLRLEVNVVKLQQEFLTQPSQVRIELVANLVNNSNNELIANRHFGVVVPSAEDNPRGGVIAANQATEQLLGQVVSFAVANT